jgi:hypothetical protein
MSLNWEDLDLTKFALWSNAYFTLTNVLLYPADLLSTRLQADRFMPHHNLRLGKLTREICAREGVRGLYRGFSTSLVASLPGQYLYFMTYEAMNQFLKNTGKNSFGLGDSVLTNGIAGMTAEAVSAMLYLPSDLVIQRLQVAQKYSFLPYKFQDRNSLGVVRRLCRTEGLRGMLRGYWPYVLTFGTDSAIWWMSYESLKRMMGTGRTEDNPLDVLKIFAASACAGVLSTLVISPFDVARTRLQLLEVGNANERATLKQGFFPVLKRIYREEGWHGLYKGIKPRVYISIPVSTISLIGYEYLKSQCML